MSVHIIGRGTISLKIHTDNAFIESIAKKMEGMASFYNVRLWDEESICFEMSGNNGIDYKQLDEIKDWLSKELYSFSIRVGEYSECGGGYSSDSKGD
jgi:hypothetical protein